MDFNTLSVVGLGYIGLPTAAVFASRKMKVIGVDVSEKAVNTINRGEIHIVEPDLDLVVHAAVTEGYLRATMTPEPADAFIIAVPTPFKDNHEADLTYIESASKAIAPVLKKGNLVILESTSPIGATEKMAEWLAEARPDLSFPQFNGCDSDIRIAHCPERVLPGHVLRELVENDRVIGGMSPACSEAAIALYKTVVKGECVVTNARTAEMAKLTENSFRDVNIAFANELSCVCDELDINSRELINLTNHHPRVEILNPGCGVGGHCIAVDPWFIVSSSPSLTPLIRTARQVNDNKKRWVIDKVLLQSLDYEKINGLPPVIGCFGITFKSDIDDLRESPAVDIVRSLINLKQQILVCEPNINKHPEFELSTIDDTVQNSNILVFLVAHTAFKGIDISNHKIIDICGVID